MSTVNVMLIPCMKCLMLYLLLDFQLKNRSTGNEQLEKIVMASHSIFCEGLEKAGLKQERRALRLSVNDLRWAWLESQEQELGKDREIPDLKINFSLPSGTYATAVLREVVLTGQ